MMVLSYYSKNVVTCLDVRFKCGELVILSLTLPVLGYEFDKTRHNSRPINLLATNHKMTSLSVCFSIIQTLPIFFNTEASRLQTKRGYLLDKES
jgi:hypothetical protein